MFVCCRPKNVQERSEEIFGPILQVSLTAKTIMGKPFLYSSTPMIEVASLVYLMHGRRTWISIVQNNGGRLADSVVASQIEPAACIDDAPTASSTSKPEISRDPLQHDRMEHNREAINSEVPPEQHDCTDDPSEINEARSCASKEGGKEMQVPSSSLAREIPSTRVTLKKYYSELDEIPISAQSVERYDDQGPPDSPLGASGRSYTSFSIQ